MRNRRPAAAHPRSALRSACIVLLAAVAAPATLRARQEAPPRAPEAAASPAPQPAGAKGRAIYGRIRGTVLGPAKRALAGLLVQLSARGDSGLLRVTGTDEMGQYAFQDLPAATYDIEVAAEGFAPQKKGSIVVRPPFQNIVDFELRPTAADASPADTAADREGAPADGAGPPVPVRGQFVDQQRRPVAEVSVTFVSLQAKREYQAFSGEDGRFSLPSVPAGRYRVLVASPGHVSLDLKSVEVSPVAGLNLSLSLVDYPLDVRGEREEVLPREEPRPAPSVAPAP